MKHTITRHRLMTLTVVLLPLAACGCATSRFDYVSWFDVRAHVCDSATREPVADAELLFVDTGLTGTNRRQAVGVTDLDGRIDAKHFYEFDRDEDTTRTLRTAVTDVGGGHFEIHVTHPGYRGVSVRFRVRDIPPDIAGIRNVDLGTVLLEPIITEPEDET